MSAWAPNDQGKRDGGFGLRIFYGITPETEHTCWFFWSGPRRGNHQQRRVRCL
jgi:hypothetical protein